MSCENCKACETSPKGALYDDVKAAIDGLLTEYRTLAVDGMTFQEVCELVASATAAIVRLVEEMVSITGDKRQLVLDAIARLWDEVLSKLNIAAIPDWIEPFVDKIMRSFLIQIASSVIDSLVQIFSGAVAMTSNKTPIVPATLRAKADK